MADTALPIVCVPGTLCDARLFDDLLAHLPRQAIHAAPIAQGDVREAAATILAVSPPRFIGLGFSLGGFAILEMLRTAPGRLAAVVLIASNTHALVADSANARRAEVARARNDGMATLIDDLWPSYVGQSARNRQDVRATIAAMAEGVGIDRFDAQAELAISRPDSHATVRDSAVPVLMIYGDQDAMCPVDRYRSASGDRLRHIELAGIGHFVPLEAPESAGRAIDDWLNEVLPCC